MSRSFSKEKSQDLANSFETVCDILFNNRHYLQYNFKYIFWGYGNP